jgi:hypothetical protein
MTVSLPPVADRLEHRLRTTDLRLPECGAHLEDERLTCILGGDEPSAEEALHLAGCDECLDVLLAASEGLEALSAEPALAAAIAGPPFSAAPRPGSVPVVAPPQGSTARRGRWARAAVVGLSVFGAFAAAAAVGWVVRQAEVAPPVQAPAVEAPAAPEPERRGAAPVERRPAVEVPPTPPTPTTAPSEAVASTETRVQASPPPPEPRARASGQTAEAARREVRTTGETREREGRTYGRMPVNGEARGFGFLRLGAVPPAEVFIGDRSYGWTPIVDLRLAEGPHDVRLVYSHPDARVPEERFRVVIPAEARWVVTRKNLVDAPTP